MKRSTQTLKYNLLSFLSFLVSLIGFIGLKLTIVGVSIGVALLSDKYIGKWGLTVGWIIGIFVGGVLALMLKRLVPTLEKLDKYTRSLRKHPYTEMYGGNYRKPKPEDFGITQAEFAEYNSRFQFELIRLIFTYGLWIGACIYALQGKLSGSKGAILVGLAAVAAILLNYLFRYWNKMLSQRHRFYPKIQRFQDALSIYHRIRDETRIF